MRAALVHCHSRSLSTYRVSSSLILHAVLSYAAVATACAFCLRAFLQPWRRLFHVCDLAAFLAKMCVAGGLRQTFYVR